MVWCMLSCLENELRSHHMCLTDQRNNATKRRVSLRGLSFDRQGLLVPRTSNWAPVERGSKAVDDRGQ
jgi:hypothetical protein